jgi:hypothetical protein
MAPLGTWLVRAAPHQMSALGTRYGPALKQAALAVTAAEVEA